MRPLLDPDTADRLAAGALPPDDAPPGYDGVARLLRSARAELTRGGLDREPETVAMIVAAVRSQLLDPAPAAAPISSLRLKLKVAAASLAGALTLGTGLAAANALPAPAQRVASRVLDTIGVTVPAPASRVDTRDDGGRDRPPVPTSRRDTAGATGTSISELARTTDATGVDKGAAVSSEASDGASHAGDPPGPQRPTPRGNVPTTTPAPGNAPVPTPNSGGNGNGHARPGGGSSKGAATPDQGGGGANPPGSANANPHVSHAGERGRGAERRS